MFHHLSYILLDAARMGEQMDEAKTRNKAHDSLYRGRSEEDLAGIAPFIFQFAHPTQFSGWILKTGWGNAWGLMLKSSWPPSELHKHFRKFLMVNTEDGNSLYFRFYDPRVLRIFLPTCDTAQLREFFGSGAIDYLILEDEDPAFGLRMWHENGFMKSERFPVAEIIAALPEPEPLEQKLVRDELPLETLAIIAELRKQYPDVELPAGSPQSEKEQPQKGQKPQLKQQPAATPPPEQTSFSPLADNQPFADKTAKQEDKLSPQPKPKTKWNMFD